MRVISGDYRGRRLKGLEGENTRPTTDKVKESIFNIIGPYFDGGRVLDLFSGSGGLAIEAVSRGMAYAVCIDRSFPATKIIHENIQVTKEPEKFQVLKMDANVALKKLASEANAFELILLDPPYAKQEIVAQIEQMVSLKLLSEDCVVVCETDKHVSLPESISTLVQTRHQIYGSTAVTIYRNEG